MYIVDRIEGNYVILESSEGKIIEVLKDELPSVLENDVLYFKDNKYFKDDKKRDKIKEDIKARFNKLRG